MKRLILTFPVVLFFAMLFLTQANAGTYNEKLYSQSYIETEINTLPSEQTYKEIQGSCNLPELRAKPPGVDGNPQGQVPLGDSHYIIIGIASIALILYKKYRLTKQLK